MTLSLTIWFAVYVPSCFKICIVYAHVIFSQEVIPDLLISVITDCSNRFESSDEDLHRAYLIYEDIATPLVKELARECVVGVLDAVVNESVSTNHLISAIS